MNGHFLAANNDRIDCACSRWVSWVSMGAGIIRQSGVYAQNALPRLPQALVSPTWMSSVHGERTWRAIPQTAPASAR